MPPSPSASRPLSEKRSAIWLFTKDTCNASFSTAETTLTTSTSTPTSMFMTVNALKRMKTSMKAHMTQFSCSNVFSKSSRSGKAPATNRTCMEVGRDLKSFSSSGVPRQTERVATAMPRKRITSSGMARSSRAMRAMRESRSSRASRRVVDPFRPALDPTTAMTTEKIQVSRTIMNTSTESKMNQASFRPSRFLRKERKRTSHSNKKKVQKPCSATWNKGSAS
mmetsp:Transcript_60175/g.193735  ORF Transcript_60175/g.193735 Transcript_60175/m.193735 type:complete len:223 (+) Transcript_60175:622-1290(+)